MDNPGATPPGENFERAEESARSVDGDAARGEQDAFISGTQRQQAQVRDFERNERLKELGHFIYTLAIKAVAGIAFIFLGVATAIVLWLILIVLVHFTTPGIGWLDSNELATLGNLYSNSAQFVAPAALITNAWLVAYFSLRRWRNGNSQTRNDATDGR